MSQSVIHATMADALHRRVCPRPDLAGRVRTPPEPLPAPFIRTRTRTRLRIREEPGGSPAALRPV